jgi:hypothetical protein
MEFRLNLVVRAVGLTLCLCAVAGSAMALDLGGILDKVKSDFSAINEKGEQDRARIRGEGQLGGIVLEEQAEVRQKNPTQLIIPKDKRTAAAMDEAMPTIKKIISIHQCLKNNNGLLQMNFHAVPGTDISKLRNPYWPKTGLPINDMEFHDNNKCLSVQSLDNWSMPALNALLFRAVYFAEDSGESANFLYLFKKVDDGSWKIAKFEKTR